MFYKKYKKEDEEVISNTIGSPYNMLPKGFPNKLKNSKIEETIQKFINELIPNAGVESIVLRNSTIINLGLNELNHRQGRKQSRIALFISILSLLFAGVALIISVLSFLNKQ